MKIIKSYKIALQPNNRQITSMIRHAGVARWSYNWGLTTWKQLYDEKKANTPEGTKVGKVTDARDLLKRLTLLKKASIEDGGVPWMYDVSKCAPQESLRDLERAYKNTFERLARGRKGGFPQYKSKHKSRKSFRLYGSITVEHKRIRLPVIGWVRLAERGYVPTDIPVKSATVSEKANKWFVSILVEINQPEVSVNIEGPIIGIDLGINALATCSDGTVYKNPKALKGQLGKIKQLSKKMARQTKTSNRRRKTKEKLARAHVRVVNIRKDVIHKMTSDVVKTKRPSVIVLENLNVTGMVKNRRLARSISDAAFGEIKRQFEYKTAWSVCGTKLAIAGRWFPSTRRCSCCGVVKSEMGLGERVFSCLSCGFTVDRDENASYNLRDYPKITTASSAGDSSSEIVGARGEDVRPKSRKAVRQTSLKREVDSEGASCKLV